MSGRPARPAAALAAISGPKLSVNRPALISACPRATPMSCASRSPGLSPPRIWSAWASSWSTSAGSPATASAQARPARASARCGEIGRRVSIKHIQRILIGTARLSGMADAAAQPPAPSEPGADQGVGIVRRYLLKRSVESAVRELEPAAESLYLGQLDQQVGVMRLDLGRLDQEGGGFRHRRHRARVVRGQDQVANGLLVLAGQDEVAGDLGRARTTARPSSRQPAGVWRSASVAQQLGDLTVQTCPDGVGDLQVDRFAQQAHGGTPPPRRRL